MSARVFVGWDCIEAALWYIFCVETQGRTLEVRDPIIIIEYSSSQLMLQELGEIFADPHPVAASLRVRKVVVTEDKVLVEE